MTVLVTGVAGFIGARVAHLLLDRGEQVLGVDNLNAYYSVSLKEARLATLQARPGFEWQRLELAGATDLSTTLKAHKVNVVIHLAAQAGVRYSIDNPHIYIESNVSGFLNVLEACRYAQVEHLVYASSSSVYGGNTKLPFSTTDAVDHPISLYAATKKANELMAHTYSHLFGLPTTGLRYFTVYGPWGRPDMAAMKFAKAILAGESIDVYNHGEMWRDFTYVDDIAEGTIRVAMSAATPDTAFDSEHPHPARGKAPFRVYNIGNHQPVKLMDFITTLERHLGRQAQMRLLPMQPGDVSTTFADTDDLRAEFGFAPSTTLDDGVGNFVRWYREYYNIN